MNDKKRNVNHKTSEAFNKYEEFTNEIVGILAFSLALQCIGFNTEEKNTILGYHFSDRFLYSFASFIFINIVLLYRANKIKKYLIK